MEYMMMPLKRYADFSGRSRRMEYWMWVLLQVIVYIVVLMLTMMFGGGALMSGDPSAAMAAGGAIMLIFGLYGIYSLAILIPSLAVSVRRLHDTDRTGWWILAPLAPYLLTIVAGMMLATSPDMAAMAGILALVSMIAVVVLGLVLLVFYFMEGTRGPNKYGPDPKGQDTGQVFA
jgi:uncharacterized membrane protein YhaH (DUF805 family)